MKKSALLFTIIFITLSLHSQTEPNYQPFRQCDLLKYYGYQFKIFPGTEAWKALDINADKHALLQLPDDTLSVISTQRLVETCLYYPMIMDVLASDNLAQGFGFIRGKFNGLEELYRRVDAADCLLSYYQQRIPDRITAFEESFDRGRYSLDFVFLELMISQWEVIQHLERVQIQQFTQSILQKLEQQSALPQNYSRVFVPVSAFVAGRMLIQAGILSQETRQSVTGEFLENGRLENPEDIARIFEQAQLFIKNQ